MTDAGKKFLNVATQTGGFVLAIAFVFTLLEIIGASPTAAFREIFVGSLGSWGKMDDILVGFAPLSLATAGVVVTFAAGLWNIGVEGQIMMGAIFTTFAMRVLENTGLPPVVIIFIAMVSGIIGGALWALVAGALKNYGGVNEIFGGLGLNYIATAISMWLIFGPWKRPGIGSMAGTEPFPETLWLTQSFGSRLCIASLAVSVAALVFTTLILSGTRFGLRLKAIGLNMRSSLMLGIPVTAYILIASAVGGGLAGLAGSLQVAAVYHKLIPSISSGYGFLGIMIALLIKSRAVWIAPVALFFAAVNIGGIQLPVSLDLDSSLSGILQGSIVLFVILTEGVRRKYLRT